jgi:Flp pilus assembly pilin Flp
MRSRLVRFVVEFIRSEDGPTSVEYAINVALIVGIMVSQISSLASNAKKTFSSVSNAAKNTGS